ncbi:MAG TPA: hypothetical protein VM008_10440 [Phycisphaerae bacterium]|nr:hypothetical protein [Phycisphaerae bacterium]
MQELIVILVVAACGLWMAWQGYRCFRPRPGAKLCGGNCCDGEAKGVESKPGGAKGERVMMISSDDLRARVAARKG